MKFCKKELPILAPYSSSTYNIGLIRLSSIGDVILASSCLNLLAQVPFPVHVTWIGRSLTINLLRSSYPEVSYIAVDNNPPIFTLLRQLAHLDLLVDLQRNFRSSLLRWFFAAYCWRPREVIEKASFARSLLVWRAYAQGRKISPRGLAPANAPRTLQYQNMVNTLSKALRKHCSLYTRAPHEDIRPRLFPSKNSAVRDEVASLLAPFGQIQWLAIAPGASFPAKRAPQIVLRTIIAKLSENLHAADPHKSSSQFGLFVLGDKADQAACGEFLEQLAWEGPLLNLSGRLGLEACQLLLAHALVVLSNDSGLSHLAEAVGTPAMVLFGPTVEAFGFSPQLGASRSFSASLGCRPCSKHGKTPCRFGDQRCFIDIDTAHVARSLMDCLADYHKNF